MSMLRAALAEDRAAPSQAMDILRAGVQATPELRTGLGVSVSMASVMALGKMIVPISIQQIIDRGITSDGLNWSFVLWTCGLAALAIIALGALNTVTYRRLMRTAENVIYGLRTRAFAHIHRLSVGTQNDSKRGVMVARVTSDIETLAQFASWGAISWVINLTVIAIALGAIAIYSWQLAIVVVVVLLPIIPILRLVQRKQLDAYDQLRTRVGETLTEISESVMGMPVIRAYGNTGAARHRLRSVIREQFFAQRRSRFYFAIMFPVSDVFSGFTLAAVVGVGVWFGPDWGLGAGTLIAVVFLANMIVQPVAEIGEVLDQTQTALAGWKKVLDLIDTEVTVVEPTHGTELPTGALSVEFDDVTFSYDAGVPVLHNVNINIAPGTNVAIVGKTGSGKSTTASLMCRLADPDSGSVRIGGVDLRDVDPTSRTTQIRLVPQDGFLFDTTLIENIRYGAAHATHEEILAACDDLGLTTWVESLPLGLESEVGERGESLSVGERQLVALIRAQLADPGLLILDEATSSVDPETEQTLATALAHLADGRTTVSIAHRMSTAEAADVIAVFEAGVLTELGSHEELLGVNGIYAGLFESWIGNTQITS